jgi:hypothetical protein
MKRIINAIEHLFNPVIEREEENPLNQVDLCFVIDTTASMSPFILEAQRQLLDTISALGAKSGIDLKVGLVEYRDHPPQDNSFVTRINPLTSDIKGMQKVINKLRADGGGDAPEAVYDGIEAACKHMKWRDHSCRFTLLVGDAPPHGFKPREQETDTGRRRRTAVYGDSWESGCPCGLTAHSVSASAEIERITINALCMSNCAVTAEAFNEIAIGTGGYSAPVKNAKDVVGKILEMLEGEFRNLQFDAQVLETVKRFEEFDLGVIAEAIGCPRLQAASSIARLGRRGFF